MIKCEYEKDFQTFAWSMGVKTGESLIFLKEREKKKRIQIEHILQIIFVLTFSSQGQNLNRL